MVTPRDDGAGLWCALKGACGLAAVPSGVRGERLNPPAAPSVVRSLAVGFASCRQRTPFGLRCLPFTRSRATMVFHSLTLPGTQTFLHSRTLRPRASPLHPPPSPLCLHPRDSTPPSLHPHPSTLTPPPSLYWGSAHDIAFYVCGGHIGVRGGGF
jgi:hypothetical protein